MKVSKSQGSASGISKLKVKLSDRSVISLMKNGVVEAKAIALLGLQWNLWVILVVF